MRRLVAAVTILAAGVPASASAADFCVNRAGCEPARTDTQLQFVLDQAESAPGFDRVLVGPGLYSASGGFTNDGPDRTDVIGAGGGQSVLTSTADNSVVLASTSNASIVEGLTLRIRGGSNGITGYQGTGTVRDVQVVTPGPAAGSVGFSVGPGTLQRVSAELPATPGGGNRGVFIFALSGSVSVDISDSRFVGNTGIAAENATVTVVRSRVSARDDGIFYRGGSMRVDSTLVRTTGPAGRGLVVSEAAVANPSILAAQHVTLVGAGVAGGDGLTAISTSSGARSLLVIDDSVVRGYQTAARAATGTASSQADVGIATTDWEETRRAITGLGVGFITGPGENGNRPGTTPPGWIDETAEDFRLRFDSPLIDRAGSVAPLSATDLLGQPRLVGGARDMGAFEYQRRAPVLTTAASPASRFPGEPFTFTAGASDPDGDALSSVAWAFDDGAGATGASVDHAFSTPGAHTATATVTDASGLSRTSVVTVTVATPAGGDPPPPPPIDLPPEVVSFSANPTRVAWVLSEGATVRIRVFRRVAGRRAGGTCRPASPALRRRSRCIRLVELNGALVSRAMSFDGSVRWGSRLRGRRLRAGSYVLQLVGRDSVGQRTAPAQARVTIPPPRRR